MIAMALMAGASGIQLSPDAENRKMAHKPVAHPIRAVQSGTDGELTREPARKMDFGMAPCRARRVR
jgi:hypothetical protein